MEIKTSWASLLPLLALVLLWPAGMAWSESSAPGMDMGTDASPWTVGLLQTVEQQAARPGGSAVFLGLFIVLYMLTVPCTILETAGGYFFGASRGFALGMAGKMVGTLFSMLLARTVLKAWVRLHVAPLPAFKVFERVIQNTGFAGLFLSRLLPNLVKNYGVALLDIPQKQLALAVVLNNLLFSILWAHVGSSTHNMVLLLQTSSLSSQLGQLQSGQKVGMGVMLLLGCATVTYWGRLRWRQAEAEIARDQKKE